ncbi:MAG: 2-oxoglutarate dehydrogenase complex dihydrolipoyllysine-residue succinyltransferase [Isosphaeraceae bacterium]
MAGVPITVPGVGESISEGILARWLKQDGAVVKSGEPLFELETDKASNVIPAAASGVLKIGVAEGTTIAIGSSVGSIDPDGTPAASSDGSAGASRAAAAAATNGGSPAAVGATLAPSVRRIVAEEKVDPSQIEGTGRGGRLTKGDVLAHLATPAAPAEATPPPAAKPAAAAAAGRPPALPAGEPRETRQRMSGIRQRIAQRLVEAQQTAAILTTFNEADMSRIMELRAKYKDSFKAKHGVALGFMSFFVKAVVRGLQAFPAVNGRIDGTDIVYNNVYDVGVAVSTERGLMVPVVRDCDKLSLAGIEKAIAGFAVKARENAIAVSDLQGGTFTITNGGVFGSLLSTPILNPPQSGILGMHAIQKRPVVVDDQIVVRPMMYLAFSYDHRIIDGREAVSFLVNVKEGVENPERLMLDV